METTNESRYTKVKNNVWTVTGIKTRYARGKAPVEHNLTISFEGVDRDQIIEWALANRVIAFQGVLRKMDSEEIFENFLYGDGANYTVHANSAGSAIETPEQKKRRILELLKTADASIIAELGIDPESLK